MAESTRKSFVVRKAQHAKLLEVAEQSTVSGMVTLIKDVAFSSPSAAGAIVYGRASANGRLTWKTEQGNKIGRASCRERAEMSAVNVAKQRSDIGELVDNYL